jgi:hypothetical protein
VGHVCFCPHTSFLPIVYCSCMHSRCVFAQIANYKEPHKNPHGLPIMDTTVATSIQVRVGAEYLLASPARKVQRPQEVSEPNIVAQTCCSVDNHDPRNAHTYSIGHCRKQPVGSTHNITAIWILSRPINECLNGAPALTHTSPCESFQNAQMEDSREKQPGGPVAWPANGQPF